MVNGPAVAPMPQEAWSQLTMRGEKRVAAKALMPASIAPPPRPPMAAKRIIHLKSGAAE